ncbi:MAG: hypothetical protein K2G31_00965, partial [Clostridia bacterium]|nr:hypothetical protein [Clostridia bacterium]
EKATREEQLRTAEAERDEANEKLRLYHEEQLAEEERKRTALLRPSANINELFAKLNLESEYNRPAVVEHQTVVEEVAVEAEPVQIQYIEERPRRQQSMEEIFRLIDERKAQHAEERAREKAFAQMEAAAAADNDYYESDLQNSDVVANGDGVTSAVIDYNAKGFAYENASVNYRDFFYSIDENQQPKPEPVELPKQQQQYSDDIKTRLYAKGFKVRPYDRGNTSEYYTYNFVQSNRINRDTFLIILALFVVEVAVMWVSLASRISYKYFLPVLLVGSALCLVPTVLYLINPNKRTRANFNFKLSVLNRTMLFIELSVVCILIGFFALGASVKDIDIILSAIILPAVLLLDLPISSIVYYLLYRTHKYHIS